MHLNSSRSAEVSEGGNNRSTLGLVPHIWSAEIGTDFLPTCDPTPIVAHLICREMGFDTYTALYEVDTSSYSGQKYVALTCPAAVKNINDCTISSASTCPRLAELSCGKCGGDVQLEDEKPIVVTSPGYPYRLLPVVGCRWNFISPSKESPVQIEFDDFDLPHNCKVGGVRVGSLLRSGYLLTRGNRVCGDEKPEEFESHSTVAVLSYYSWLGSRAPKNMFHRGFRAVVRIRGTDTFEQSTFRPFLRR